jgi:hypothetical protein
MIYFFRDTPTELCQLAQVLAVFFCSLPGTGQGCIADSHALAPFFDVNSSLCTGLPDQAWCLHIGLKASIS